MFDVEIFRRPIYLKNCCGIAKSNHFESALFALSIYQKSSFVGVLFASFADEAALRSWDVFVFMWKMFLQFDCAILRIRKREMNSVWNSARSSVDLNVIDMWHESYFITYPAERSVVFKKKFLKNVSNFFQTRVHVVDRGCSSRFTQTSLLTEQYAVHSKLRALCATNLESSFKILLLFFFCPNSVCCKTSLL